MGQHSRKTTLSLSASLRHRHTRRARATNNGHNQGPKYNKVSRRYLPIRVNRRLGKRRPYPNPVRSRGARGKRQAGYKRARRGRGNRHPKNNRGFHPRGTRYLGHHFHYGKDPPTTRVVIRHFRLTNATRDERGAHGGNPRRVHAHRRSTTIVNSRETFPKHFRRLQGNQSHLQ